ncbi:MAG: hypothetical protein HY033_02370 [Ignavibacteriae bacterium]|nr:hypothetical protein [Ignavibacteriota bacterium]
MERSTQLDPKYINAKVKLPYDLTVDEVTMAVSETYRLFNGVNNFLTTSGFRPLEELLLGNSLSGILSEFLVKNIAGASHSLVANLKVGGHTDLLPKGFYSSNLILKGEEGIEVKSSIQRGGWQGHNPEKCWLMVFRYVVGKQDGGEVVPLKFVEILCAKLTKKDWSFSGRKGASRRTPTASITTSGVEKLRSNFLYRLPEYGVGKHQKILSQHK